MTWIKRMNALSSSVVVKGAAELPGQGRDPPNHRLGIIGDMA